MLIEKMLAERYPDMLRLQMSCHATHIEEERVLPCGKCEKCRRIVGMLVALGGDPTVCGYSLEQIEKCLEDLKTRPVRQEAASVRQLGTMLARKGLPGFRADREHPEILKVRIDRERSPVEDIPVDLRRPLYKIFLEHASGAVRRHGRMWVDFDLMTNARLDRPYPFERGGASLAAPGGAIEGAPAESMGREAAEAMGRAVAPGPPQAEKAAVNTAPRGAQELASPEAPRGEPLKKRPWVLGELTWPEARARFKEVDLALLPVGAIEQHGPHSPLDTDAFDAEHLSHLVAQACSDPKPLVLPLIPYGVSYHHEDFPGTLSVSNESLARFVYEIGMSAARNGITKLVIVNGHGGNAPTLQFAAQMINRDAHIFSCVDSGETSDEDISKICDTPNDVHAGEVETSTTLAVRPHLVEMDKAKRFVPRFSSAYLDMSGGRRVEWYAHTLKISQQGTLGDPTKATHEKGERIWEIMVRNLVEFVEHLKKMTLDQIYERRY
jgi:creatinine amidohydrolase/Fe(II)-dependent formamide hydrolase-like protein